MDWWVRLEHGSGGLPTPLVVPCACITGSTLLLLPAPQKWQLSLGLLYLVHNLPNWASTWLFLVSWYSAAQGDICPGASAAVDGPQVVDCLLRVV